MPSLIHPMIGIDEHDFVTCLPVPPPSDDRITLGRGSSTRISLSDSQ
jgi:hypothetical protein